MLATLTTDFEGKATLDDLPLGKYKVVEIKAPAGFVVDPEAKEVELKYKGKYILCYGKTMEMNGVIKNKNDIKIVYVEDTDFQGHGFFRCKATIIQIKYNDEYNLVSHIGAEDYGEVYVSFEQDKQYSFYENDIERILTKEEVIELLDEAKAVQIDMMDEWKKCLQ